MELDPKWNWVNTSSRKFTEALDAIFNTEDNLCILGMGGTGKSILLRIAYSYNPNSIVLGSTGISAANLVAEGVPATTVHSALRIPPVPVFDNSVKFKQDSINILCKASTVFIDEVSMINASLMDFILKMSLKSKDVHVPRFVLFGDMFQLPPIKTNDKVVSKYFQKKYDDNYFFFNSTLFSKFKFRTIHLDEVYRQKDPTFKNTLNRIRLGFPSKEDLDLINSRVTDKNSFIKNHEFMMYLATTNKQVDSINYTYTQGSKFNKRMSYTAITGGDFDLSKHPQIKPHVEIVEGQQVMCLFNNRERGYQNGTLGKVLEVKPDGVLIQKSDGVLAFVVPDTWKKYEFAYDPKKNEVDYTETGYCTQIGCKPAFAVTLHKSQGLSLDALYLDLSSRFIPEAGVYLALSRCRTLEGIGLSRKITEDDIKINPEALEFFAATADNSEVV